MKVAAFWQPFVRGYAPLFGLPKQTTTNLSAVIATCYCNLRNKDFESSGKDSYLTIQGANSGDFSFSTFSEIIYDDPSYGPIYGPWGLAITSTVNPDCLIKITNWSMDQQFSGITFDNGEFLSYEDINKMI